MARARSDWRVVASACVVIACAAKNEASVRDAWNQAVRLDAGKAGTQGDDDLTDPTGAARSTSGPWKRLGSMVERAGSTLSSGDYQPRIDQLVEDWCFVEPSPQPSERGDVRVCVPSPPLLLAGESFSLELADEGVIGLVAIDVSETASGRLVAQALEQGRSWCAGPWTEVPPRGQAHEEFHTCPLTGGPILVAGRFPRDLGADLWQVSITVMRTG